MTPSTPEPSSVERTGVLAGDPSLLRDRDVALGALTTVRAESLAPLVRAVAVGDAHALTHLVPADAVELAMLRERVPLRPGHVVTVLVAVLDALDALHRAHLAHGDVAGERVLVGPDGSVVLGGCGLAWAVPPGAADGPLAADDVADVALLARQLLGPGSAPPALVIALLRAADTDPVLRPDAASLAAAVRAALAPEPLLDLLWLAAPAPQAPRPAAVEVAPTEPVVVPVSASSPIASSPTSRPTIVSAAASPASLRALPRRRGRRLDARPLLAVLAAIALPLVAWSALRLPTGAAADPAPPAAPTPTTTPTTTPTATPTAAVPTAAPTMSGTPSAPVLPTDWGTVLRALDGLRHRAVVAGSTSRLAGAVDPHGGAWADDAALVARVRATGARLVGGELVPSAVQVLDVGASSVRLRVRDVRTAYDVTAGGTTTHVAARPERVWDVTLVRYGEGWRIGDVDAAGPRPQ